MRLLTTVIWTAVGLCFQASNSYSQARVTGHVFDENNQPLPGVSVIVKGTASGTSTDARGAFSIPTLPTSTLAFAFIGYHTMEVQVKNRHYLHIKLTLDLKGTAFAAFHVPSLSGLFIDDFAGLQTATQSMTAAIEVRFIDQTSKVGEGVAIGYNKKHLLFLSAVDLFYSTYDVPLKEIVIDFQGKRHIEGKLVLLPDTMGAMNPDLAIVGINAEEFPFNNESLFSDKQSKTYFVNSAEKLLRLSLVKTNNAYEELYFETNETATLFLGTPIYDRYGVAGLIVDNIGQTLVATQTTRTLSILQKNAILLGDSIDALFSTHKHGKKLNLNKLKPKGLYLGFNFSSNFFNGADLAVKNSVFIPSPAVFVATRFLGFDLTYEASYNQVESKPINTSSAYIRVRNTHYGHSIFLERSMFHVGRVIFSFSGAISGFESSGVVFNLLEQEIPLETALGQDIGSTFKSFSLGLKIESPRVFTDRISIFSRILLVNTNTSHLDVNINDLANSSTDDDMLFKAQLGCSFRLF